MKTKIPDDYEGPFTHKTFRSDGTIAKITHCLSYGKGFWRRSTGKIVYNKEGKKVIDLKLPGAYDELKKLLKGGESLER